MLSWAFDHSVREGELMEWAVHFPMNRTNLSTFLNCNSAVNSHD